jgi:hypothetical protein
MAYIPPLFSRAAFARYVLSLYQKSGGTPRRRHKQRMAPRRNIEVSLEGGPLTVADACGIFFRNHSVVAIHILDQHEKKRIVKSRIFI